MVADVSIIDYGINNLKSVSKAFEKIGKTIEIISTQKEVLEAKCLVIPGIGSFKNGMEGLKNKDLIKPILEKVENGTPLLGICLGMQLLFSESEEFGIHKGLNIIPGRVVLFDKNIKLDDKKYKIPQIGWNELNYSNGDLKKWKNTSLENIPEKSDVYFVHSYFAIPENKENVIATTNYANETFCSVVKKANVTGMQFHPEKSGEIGQKILITFCKMHNI